MTKNLRIFFDVDTQYDFMDKKGALYVPDAELIRPNLEQLTRYAQRIQIPVLGSVDVHFGTDEYKHRETELQRWGGPFPDHCMSRSPRKTESSNGYAASKGERKIPETILIEDDWEDTYCTICHSLDHENDSMIVHPRVWGKYVPQNILKRQARDFGIYFEKQSYDVFTNPNCEWLLKEGNVKEAVVYGVATDYCVKAAVLGMQKRGIKCYVVEDAIKGVTSDTTKSALEEMVKSGADLVRTKDVLEGRI